MKKFCKDAVQRAARRYCAYGVFALILLTQAAAQDFVVNTTNDTHAAAPASSATDADGNISLRSAIEAATEMSGAHVISFAAAVAAAGSVDLTLGEIITGNGKGGDDITVTGPGMDAFVINQTTAARIFTTGPGAITFELQDISLNYNGPATPYSGGGGAILAGDESASTTLINCKITNFRNQAGNGGAVSASSSANIHSLIITNCMFSNNECGGAGGAVSYNGLGTVTITGTTFLDNSTGVVGGGTGGGGGGLSVSGSGDGGTYTVSTSTFINNKVKGTSAQGGAILNTNGTLTVKFNRLIGNTAATFSLGNTIAQAGGSTVNTVIANDNWWGVNKGPQVNEIVVVGAGGTATSDTWLQFRHMAAANAVCLSGTGTDTTVVTADILGRNTGGPIDAANLIGLAPFSSGEGVFSNAVLGSLSQEGTQLVNGIATAVYTAGATGGAGSVTAAADGESMPADIALPLPPEILPASSSVCQGSVENMVSGPSGALEYIWSISNGTITSDNTIQNISFTAGYASPVELTLSVKNDIGCTLANTANVAAILNNTLSGTPGGNQVCASYAVSQSGTIYTDNTCSPIAKIVPSGPGAVIGKITTCVTIDEKVQQSYSQAYVQRHYDITPDMFPDFSSATLTLYFTQEEFDNYNVMRGDYPPLPTGPSDEEGRNNLRITQYHGTGTAPGNYSGTAVLIEPGEKNVLWNAEASRWEVTFDLYGFSGFYVSTGAQVLPVVLLNFSGQNNGIQNVLQWTTAGEINSGYFELQRSTDGYTFTTVSTLQAMGNNSGSQTYNYTDKLPNANSLVYYYRLKIIDKNGHFTYSSVAKIRLNATTSFWVEVSPNPFKEGLRVNIDHTQNEQANITLSDISGKMLLRKTALLRKGVNAISIANTSQFTPGIYLLTVSTHQQKKTLKVIKE